MLNGGGLDKIIDELAAGTPEAALGGEDAEGAA